jgi:hypothetical protein
MTPGQVKALSNAYGHAYNDDEWLTMWNIALDAISRNDLEAAQEKACSAVEAEVSPEIRHATCDAILALLARDLISKSQFNLLYKPWASIMDGQLADITDSTALQDAATDFFSELQVLRKKVATLEADLAEFHECAHDFECDGFIDVYHKGDDWK